MPQFLPEKFGFDQPAQYSITLCELIEDGWFAWNRSYLDWSAAAYSEEQFDRLCNAFKQRFMWREIAIIPPKRWAQQLKYKIVSELMPKYRKLYEFIDSDDWQPFGKFDEYHKERSIASEFPETLLSGNQDYASNGLDREYETVRYEDTYQKYRDWINSYRDVDMLILDELDVFFTNLISTHMNGF